MLPFVVGGVSMKKWNMNYQDRKTEVFFGRGCLDRVKDIIDQDKKVLILSQETVPLQYREQVLKQLPKASVFLVPNSEEAKSLSVYEQCLITLQNLDFTKKDIIVALGGGVVGDLAGFVASTYARGMSWIQIPTTTLAQIDSSVGGKTALNLQGIKNAVGTIWQPSVILVDGETLQTLDQRNYNNGLLEALKMGLLFDEELVEMIENVEHSSIDEIVEKSIRLKQNIVEQDETEESFRMVLNFGHTVGHAIESLSKGNLLHGECVGLGMLSMIEDEVLKNRVLEILRKMNISTSIKWDVEELMDRVYKDKKGSSKNITIVLLNKIKQWNFKTMLWEEFENKLREELQ